MKSIAFVAAVSLSALVLPANAGSQVVAGNGLTLTEAARVKFNADTRPDDRQVAVTPVTPSGDYTRLAASFGMDGDEAEGLSLAQIFVAKINHGEGATEQQLVKGGGAPIATRSVVANHAQLAASAGLTASEAAGMTLTEIAAAKFDRGPANE